MARSQAKGVSRVLQRGAVVWNAMISHMMQTGILSSAGVGGGAECAHW